MASMGSLIVVQGAISAQNINNWHYLGEEENGISFYLNRTPFRDPEEGARVAICEECAFIITFSFPM